MNLNHFEAIQTVQKLAYLVGKDDFEDVDVSIHPPFTDIRSVQTVIDADKLRFAVGAQHCHFEDKGAFTGEVSPLFLAKLNVEYVIVGHSERRQLFGEVDADVARKVVAVQRHSMTPIVCVGETLEERKACETETMVLGQIRAALGGLQADKIAALVVAYEPIWAIGTGLTATSEDAPALWRSDVASSWLTLLSSTTSTRRLERSARAATGAGATGAIALAGTVQVNVLPRPGALSSVSSPPINRAS